MTERRMDRLEFTSDGVRLFGPPELMARLWLEWCDHPDLDHPDLLIGDPRGAYFEWRTDELTHPYSA